MKSLERYIKELETQKTTDQMINFSHYFHCSSELLAQSIQVKQFSDERFIRQRGSMESSKEMVLQIPCIF